LRSGCLGLVLRIGVVAFAAVLAAVSLALIASFAVSAVGQPSGLTNVIGVVIACVAGLCFFLVGRTIWREMREKKEPKQGRD
jgi:uncharacterized iron-regulated membrane protein